MSQEVAKKEPISLEALTAEQGALLDKLKIYDKADEMNRGERKFIAYYRGRAANTLKEITDHSQFIPLLATVFPENKVRWLQYCMNFSRAVDIGKHAPVRFLPDAQLLKRDELSDDVKDKVVQAIQKATGDKGVKKVVLDYKKKLAREKAKEAGPVDALQQERGHQKNMEAIGETAFAGLLRYVDLGLTDKALVPAAIRKAIDALCVRNGREAVKLKKFKPAKQ